MSDSREKAADEIFCSSCGAIIKKEAEICPKCGVRQRVQPAAIANASEKDWLTTLLLAIFLSVFGVHRFYAGKIGTGILMILVGWLTLGIWHLIDIILIVTEKFKDGEGKLIVQKK
jgi:TM2 domain-containing membrane protein YozV